MVGITILSLPPLPMTHGSTIQATKVDVDLAKVRDRAVRLSISLPESLVPRIDAYAKSRGMSRFVLGLGCRA